MGPGMSADNEINDFVNPVHLPVVRAEVPGLGELSAEVRGVKEHLRTLIDHLCTRVDTIDNPKDGALRQIHEKIENTREHLDTRIDTMQRWLTGLYMATLSSIIIAGVSIAISHFMK